jgi:hypothetical protein
VANRMEYLARRIHLERHEQGTDHFSQSLSSECRRIRRLQKNKPRSLFPVVRARSNRVHFSDCLSKLRQNTLFSVAQLVAQFAEGFALLKDADSTTYVGEMTACLQSRCSRKPEVHARQMEPSSYQILTAISRTALISILGPRANFFDRKLEAELDLLSALRTRHVFHRSSFPISRSRPRANALDRVEPRQRLKTNSGYQRYLEHSRLLYCIRPPALVSSQARSLERNREGIGPARAKSDTAARLDTAAFYHRQHRQLPIK